MSLLTRRKSLLVKIESVYGTDPTPTGAANSMLVKNLEVQPINAELVQRDLIRDYLGNSDTIIANRHSTATFEVEFAGAGAAGVAPGYGPLLRACGFAQTLNTASVTITRSSAVATVAETSHGRVVGDVVKIAGADQTEYNGNMIIASVPNANSWTYAVTGSPVTPATGTITAGVSASYAPVSTSFESVTIYYNVDGLLHSLTGCRGTVEITMNVKQIPVYKFSMTGIYNDPSDTVSPTTDFSNFQIPKIANTANTPALSLFGFDGYVEQLTVNMANEVVYRTLIGYEDIRITDRKPAGTIVLEATTIATQDFWSLANEGTTGALALTHGIAGGNKVLLAAPRVSIGNPQYQDSQGVQMLSIPLVISPENGNDELVITVK